MVSDVDPHWAGHSNSAIAKGFQNGQFKIFQLFNNVPGFLPSPAFVREPEGNGCIERFFRTLKEQLLWVRHFQSVPELVRALEEFRALYNQHWLIERLGFEPPVQARHRLALQPAA